MTFFKSFFASFGALTLVDFIFFMAMILLIILIVSLLYFIKINREEESEELIEASNEIDNVISENMVVEDNSEPELIDLASITKALEERKNNPIEMTDYEQEQEERAIISYEELLEKSKNLAINYENDEKIEDDVSIKKIDLGNITKEIEESKPKFEIRVISYKREEAFLEALKNLKEQIN